MRPFTVQFGSHCLRGDIIGPSTEPEILVLHGAGDSSRVRFQALRESLALKGATSAAFDFIGHGETGGSISESSLDRRADQAAEVLQALPFKTPMTLVGSSMGADTATRLVCRFDCAALILLVPALYDEAAADISFGCGFTERIRVPESWRNTAVFARLANWTGRLLVAEAEQDEVIPKDGPRMIIEGATRAAHRDLLSFRSSHMLVQHLRDHPEELERLTGHIVALMG